MIPNILYTLEGCRRCDILKTALSKTQTPYVESRDYPTDVTEFPCLVMSGKRYNFVDAMNLLKRMIR